MNQSWLKIHQDRARHIAPTRGFVEIYIDAFLGNDHRGTPPSQNNRPVPRSSTPLVFVFQQDFNDRVTLPYRVNVEKIVQTIALL